MTKVFNNVDCYWSCLFYLSVTIIVVADGDEDGGGGGNDDGDYGHGDDNYDGDDW